MTSPLNNRLEQAMAQLEEHKKAVAGFTDRIANTSTTVTSKSRSLSVTVNAQGELAEVKFLTGGYRSMAPKELGALIVDTVKHAQWESREKAAGLFAELLPAGLPVLDMLTRPVDFDEVQREIEKTFKEANGNHGSGERL